MSVFEQYAHYRIQGGPKSKLQTSYSVHVPKITTVGWQ